MSVLIVKVCVCDACSQSSSWVNTAHTKSNYQLFSNINRSRPIFSAASWIVFVFFACDTWTTFRSRGTYNFRQIAWNWDHVRALPENPQSAISSAPSSNAHAFFRRDKKDARGGGGDKAPSGSHLWRMQGFSLFVPRGGSRSLSSLHLFWEAEIRKGIAVCVCVEINFTHKLARSRGLGLIIFFCPTGALYECLCENPHTGVSPNKLFAER